MAQRITMTELTRAPGRYIDAAIGGEAIHLTRHNRVVAAIVPASEQGQVVMTGTGSVAGATAMDPIIAVSPTIRPEAESTPQQGRITSSTILDPADPRAKQAQVDDILRNSRRRG